MHPFTCIHIYIYIYMYVRRTCISTYIYAQKNMHAYTPIHTKAFS